MDILFIYPAESEGFEPPIRRNAYTAFRVRLFRPLRQLSFASALPITTLQVVSGTPKLEIFGSPTYFNFRKAVRSPFFLTNFFVRLKSGCKGTAFF